uniref:glycosyl hydrolase 115 family protein n=1 Tax=Persicitalea sp. TaxID=3100273 RepID=UPI003593045A
THKVIGQAVEKGDTTYCIMNVSNIREFQYGIAASSDMLWDYTDFDTEKFEKKWFNKYYGKHAGRFHAGRFHAGRVAEAYETYFNSFALTEDGRTLALMDGQTRSAGLGILNGMKKQIKDPTAYAAEQKRKREESAERKWGSTALGDMRVGYSEREAQLAAVRRQKVGFAKADALSAEILPVLQDHEKTFFQNNFVSHVKIMLGLETWLENMILAQEAVDKAQLKSAAKYLESALKALDLVDEGKKLNVQTDKWQHWYRGDRKMNLGAVRQSTGETLELIR